MEDHLPPLVPYDQLVEGTLYQVDVYHDDGLLITDALPYRGLDRLGRLQFGDGPNGLWVRSEHMPRIREFNW